MRPRRPKPGVSLVRRAQIVLASIATIAVAIVFYYLFVPPARVPQPQATPGVATEPELAHPLSGEPVATTTGFFVTHIMYDNISEVKQRFGLEHARVVYEALAEGGITRLMALFDSTEQVPKIGPVRSVRPYFIDWASEYGGVLMHVGGSFEALKLLAKSTALIDLDEIGAYEDYFVRDESKPAPHNVFTSHSSWLRLAERRDVPHASFTPWHFSSAVPTSTAPVQKITITYSPSMTVAWVYNGERNSYVRFINGLKDTFVSGDQVSATNVAILIVPTQTIDVIGRQQMKTLGSGTAVILAQGTLQQGTWSKKTRESRTQLIAEDASDMSFLPGVTWVEIVPSTDSVQTKQ